MQGRSDMSLAMRKPDFCICENKDADQLRGNRKADQRLCFRYMVATIRMVQSLYYLNPKFQASSHFLWLYSLVCVGPGRKPRRPVFSQRGSYNTYLGQAQAKYSRAKSVALRRSILQPIDISKPRWEEHKSS